jgi:hypothetical protein
MEKMFCFKTNYAALDEDGGLIALLETQAEWTAKNNQDFKLIVFKVGYEYPPSFVSQSDIRVKCVNIFDTEAFLVVCKHELADCLEPVLQWIMGICPQGKSWYNEIQRDLASRIL